MEAYLGLFAVSFLAATLLPAYSELVFAGLLSADHDPMVLWAVASAGNTLGAIVNWLLGRYLLHFQGRRWFPVRAESMARAQRWFQRYGVWTLLMAWAPVVGDALTLVAGVMRVRFPVFLVLTAAGKAARYAIVLGLVEGFGAAVGA